MLNIRVNHPKNANCWPNTLQSPGGMGVVMYFQRYQHTFLTGYKLHTNNYSIKLGKHSKFVSYSNYNFFLTLSLLDWPLCYRTPSNADNFTCQGRASGCERVQVIAPIHFRL